MNFSPFKWGIKGKFKLKKKILILKRTSFSNSTFLFLDSTRAALHDSKHKIIQISKPWYINTVYPQSEPTVVPLPLRKDCLKLSLYCSLKPELLAERDYFGHNFLCHKKGKV